MNEHFLYLLIDLGCIAVPFVFSFHSRLRFDREWRWFLPANALVAIFYLLWDEWFTRLGIWGFSDRYTTGVTIGHLPIEEVLFFVCIPYACVFTYFVFKKYKFYRIAERRQLILWLMVIILLIYLVAGWAKMYTTTAVLAGYIVLRLLWQGDSQVLRAFVVMYVATVPFFLMSNGLLTGYGLEEPVVWYDDTQNLGLRLITIPVEDFVYGFSLLGANVLLYERLKKSLS